MAEFIDNHCCFVCGEKNPLGLKMDFHPARDGDGIEAEIAFPGHLQGWEKVVHGGLQATVLDEMLIKAAKARGIDCATAEITVKFIVPARTEVPYRLRGRIREDRGRLLIAESEMADEAGKVLARASGKLIKVSPAK